MQYFTNYAGTLRCIGQFLHNHEIEAFEIKTHADEFRLLVGDPTPPYTALIELKFSVQDHYCPVNFGIKTVGCQN
jgi:hypothetical protein